MIKKYVLLMVLVLSSFSVFALGEKTYKDELPYLVDMLGVSETLAIRGFEIDNVNNTNDNASFVGFNTVISTQLDGLSSYSYYLSDNKNILVNVIYGYGKVYKIYLRIQYMASTTQPEQREFITTDLEQYLNSNQWNTSAIWKRAISEYNSSYEKDTVLITFDSKVNVVLGGQAYYEIILTDKTLSNELSEKMDVEQLRKKAAETYNREDSFKKSILIKTE